MTNRFLQHIRWAFIGLFIAASVCDWDGVTAQESFKPGDPIASIDGDPIFLGELNYLLASKLKAKDLSSIPMDVQRASSALLVRQHLAMRSLRAQGGENLQSTLDRDWSSFLAEIRRNGLTVERYSKQTKSNEQSIRRSVDWDSAWRTYLKSTMTDRNLKSYYERRSDQYASAKWNVSHLFIATDANDADSVSLGQQKIKELAEQLSKENSSAESVEKMFAELAIQESEGATASDGGKLGWVSRSGDLPKAVMDGIYRTPAQSMSQPIKSPLGFHLIFVHEKSTSEIPFEKIEDLNKLRRDAAKALFDALVSRQQNAKVTWYIKQLKPPGN